MNDTAIESIAIYLRSTEAEINLSSSHKIFYLSELISVHPDTNILVGLTDFECPYSFYTIRQGINDKIMTGYDTAKYPSPGSEFFTSIIPEGNYDIDQLLVVLNGLTCFTNPHITLAFNNRTNKLTLTRTGEYTGFSFTTETTAWYELGIPKNSLIDVVVNQAPTLTSPYTLPNVINLGGSSCVYVRINNLGIKNLNSKGDSDGVIAKVLADVLPDEYIYYKTAEYFYFMTNKGQVREIDIEILDDQYRPIDLKGGIFSLTLTLHFAYKKYQRYAREYYLEGRVPQAPSVANRDGDIDKIPLVS